MSSQYDPILDALFEGKKVTIAKRDLNLNAFRVTFHRRDRERKRAWGEFYESKRLAVHKRINPETRIPELTLKLVDKPEKPVYTFLVE